MQFEAKKPLIARRFTKDRFFQVVTDQVELPAGKGAAWFNLPYWSSSGFADHDGNDSVKRTVRRLKATFAEIPGLEREKTQTKAVALRIGRRNWLHSWSRVVVWFLFSHWFCNERIKPYGATNLKKVKIHVHKMRDETLEHSDFEGSQDLIQTGEVCDAGTWRDPILGLNQ